jgi:hypothetical protein
MIIITRKELEELSSESKIFKECIMPYLDGRYVVDEDLEDLFEQIKLLSKEIDYNNTIRLIVRDTNLTFDEDNFNELLQDRNNIFKDALQIARDKRYFVIIILDVFDIVIFFNEDGSELITKFNKFDYKLYFPFCIDLSDRGFHVNNLEVVNHK